MLFNSLKFALFLPVVFFLYWVLLKRNYKHQNILLLIASYYFYASWDFRFLFLLIFSTLLDYYSGIKIGNARTENGKKLWLWTSIIINVGFLAVFKYYNFFAESFAQLVHGFGLKAHPPTLNIVLPVGISFYTFHGLSYVIDIYKNRIRAERNYIDYAVFVSFFPLLVAGPIERATHLLPQIQKEREFNLTKIGDGLRQILWGLVKKVLIADTSAQFANMIFDQPGNYGGGTLILGAIFFAIQIYGDFSGYSDIALGTARLFGIELMKNFSYPYFSRDIAEFWRRWHISLSSWFRDYLYIPLGGSRGSMWMKIRNTFIIFLVSGFWHGANWTFIAWGALHAVYFLPLLVLNRNRNNLEIAAIGRHLPTFREFTGILFTFLLVTFAWIFFRAENMAGALHYITRIFSTPFFSQPAAPSLLLIILVIVFFIIEWIGREEPYAIARLFLGWPRIFRWSLYVCISLAILVFSGEEQQFIYFQF